MPVADAVLLIGAVTGVIAAAGLIATPITVAIINRGAKGKKEEVEQGQPVDHLGTLIADLTEARDYERRRAEEAEARERHLLQVLVDHDLPTD